MLAILTTLLGSRLGIAALAGLAMIIALPIAFAAGFLKGKWQTEATMISAIEKANLENEIALLKEEKKLAEESRKQAEADNAELEKQAAILSGEVNEYKDKLDKAGRKCDLSPDDYCTIYGMRHPKCDRKGKKTGNTTRSLAVSIQTHRIASYYGQRIYRSEAVCWN